MSVWSATKAKRVYAALLRLSWTLKKQVGSHRKLQRPGWQNFTFCFHDNEEVGPAVELLHGGRGVGEGIGRSIASVPFDVVRVGSI